MLRKSILLLFVLLASVVAVFAQDVFPSTNAENETKGWAYVRQESFDLGTTDLEFISTRNFYSCFEYRTDGDTTQTIGSTNPNSGVTDGLYPYTCQSNSSVILTIHAREYVEVRMAFGAESDERFDWVRFDVIPKETCMNGGWATFGFANQGQCIRFFNTGEDSR